MTKMDKFYIKTHRWYKESWSAWIAPIDKPFRPQEIPSGWGSTERKAIQNLFKKLEPWLKMIDDYSSGCKILMHSYKTPIKKKKG